MKLKEEKKLSKVFLSIVLFSALSVLMILGCSKTEGESSSSKDEIKFTVGSMPNTKTAYTQDDKSLQLIWIDDDQVSIFCDQAAGEGNKQVAAYKVIPNGAAPQNGTLSIAEGDGIGLRWNDDKTKSHNLYAVYPSIGNSNKYVEKVSEGFFTFDFPKTQECSIAGGYKAANGSYMLKPDMNLAYMVAEPQTLTPTNKPAKLLFKPIATTLEITLQGAAQGDVGISELQLSVKNIADQYVKDNSDKSTYQIQFNAKKDFSKDVSSSLTAYTSESIKTANFTLKLSGGGNYTLKARESVTFTVFLPPIKNLDDVTVKCIGSDGATELGQKQILTTQRYASPASKSFFKMPPFNIIKDITISPDPLNIELGNSGKLTATVTMSNGSTTPTTGFKWVINSSNGVVTGNSTENTINLKGAKVGTTTITVTYRDRTSTATVNVITKSTYTEYDYYMWDAPIDKPYATLDGGSYNYNSNNGNATKSCKDAPTYEQLQMYLGAEVYWVTDGPAYKLPDGRTHRTGLMVKKSDKIPGFGGGTAKKATSITPKTGYYESLKEDYFFLPACGYFGSAGSFFFSGGEAGYYWSSAPYTEGSNSAYNLFFYSRNASVAKYSRGYCCVPMPLL